MLKKLTLSFTLILITSTPIFAQSVPIERGAQFVETDGFSRRKLKSFIDPGVKLIRAYGWRCDSISAVRPFVFSRGFTLVCNNYNYTYDISDKGGNWVVELK